MKTMKLICVNTNAVKFSDTRYLAAGLVEGQIYETDAKPFVDENGREN